MTTSLHINLNALDESFIEELRQRYGAAEVEILLPINASKTGKALVHIPRKSYETYSNEAGWEDAD